MKSVYTFSRYAAAFLILFYGFAKINGAQFTILESELDKPMREVSGFWLTWYYFGYSAIYGNVIALVQILGGALLLFRRTTLLGACILFGVVGNIILIDIFFAISAGALQVAIFIEACLAFILWQHRTPLLDLLWRSRNPVYAADQDARAFQPAKYAIRVVIILFPAVFTYWVANYNNRVPTPLDGRWEVVDVSGWPADSPPPTRIYFEHNRAFMSVFKYPDSSATRHFTINRRDETIQIWERWMRKGEQVFTGRYQLDGDTLELRGTMYDAPIQMSLASMK